MPSIAWNLARAASRAVASSRAAAAASRDFPVAIAAASHGSAVATASRDSPVAIAAASHGSAVAAARSRGGVNHSPFRYHLVRDFSSAAPPYTPTSEFNDEEAYLPVEEANRVFSFNSGRPGTRKMHSCPVGSLSGIDVPSSVDWTKSGILGPVKMQAANDCWNFSVLESIAAINAMTTGEYVELSKRQLNDCNWKNSMLIGGYSWYAFEYVIKNGGVVPEANYPYVDKMERWRKIQNVPLITISDYGIVPRHDPDALCRAIARQPVVVSLAIDFDFSIHKGVLLPACLGSRTVNHDVLAVGFTKERWKLMNTWGCSWGDKGFAELPRSLDGMGGAYGEDQEILRTRSKILKETTLHFHAAEAKNAGRAVVLLQPAGDPDSPA